MPLVFLELLGELAWSCSLIIPISLMCPLESDGARLCNSGACVDYYFVFQTLLIVTNDFFLNQ